MPYNFSQTKERINGVLEWYKKECSSIRTGRATPAVLDSVMVESYGARVPMNQVGSMTAEDSKTLRITPWDMTQAKGIEKAIQLANLGLSVVLDDKGVRVMFPDLTAERRTGLVKIAKEKLEEARKSLRMERDKTWNDIQAKEKEGGMGEDEKFRLKKDMEKLIEEANAKLEETFEKKENEILN